MTWNELVELEPRLHALPKVAELAGKLDVHGYNDSWYRHVKAEFLPLVGWGRDPAGLVERPLPGIFSMNHPSVEWNHQERRRLIACEPEASRVLFDSDAYDVVYDHLLKIYEDNQPASDDE